MVALWHISTSGYIAPYGYFMAYQHKWLYSAINNPYKACFLLKVVNLAYGWWWRWWWCSFRIPAGPFGFLLNLTTSRAALGGSLVLDFHHWSHSPRGNPYLPSLFAFTTCKRTLRFNSTHAKITGAIVDKLAEQLSEIILLLNVNVKSLFIISVSA